MTQERLQKVLAAAGVASRRKAEKLIVEGKVSVNGQVVTKLGTQVDAVKDTVRVEGEKIRKPGKKKLVYILLYKPREIVSTTSDDRGRKTVLDLVPGSEDRRILLAGRLDYHSEGLILLTDDGDLVYGLTSPQHRIPKTYQVKVRGVPDQRSLKMLREGVRLEDGVTRPAYVEIMGPAETNTWVEISITEGRNRQVRRMFETVGYPVQKLIRVSIGGVSVEGLAPGQSREMSREELQGLRDQIAQAKKKPLASSPSKGRVARKPRAR